MKTLLAAADFRADYDLALMLSTIIGIKQLLIEMLSFFAFESKEVYEQC